MGSRSVFKEFFLRFPEQTDISVWPWWSGVPAGQTLTAILFSLFLEPAAIRVLSAEVTCNISNSCFSGHLTAPWKEKEKKMLLYTYKYMSTSKDAIIFCQLIFICFYLAWISNEEQKMSVNKLWGGGSCLGLFSIQFNMTHSPLLSLFIPFFWKKVEFDKLCIVSFVKSNIL